eukprot:maker-scaffold_6-snap-gene-6.16-mRNA-1 protein AED:0.02 eAED:0.02 QI:101/1/1/1/0.25/0.2/5/69/339
MSNELDEVKLKTLSSYAFEDPTNVSKEDTLSLLKMYTQKEDEIFISAADKTVSSLFNDKTSLTSDKITTEILTKNSELHNLFLQKTEVKRTKAIMRGLIKLIGDKLIWEGKWAESSEKFKTEQKEKFKYEFEGNSWEEKEVDGDKYFGILNSKVSGFFMLKQEGKVIQYDEKKVILRFAPFEGLSQKVVVQGSGTNAIGDFEVSGLYDPKSGKLGLEKVYVEKSQLQKFYEGDFDEDEEIDSEGVEVDEGEDREEPSAVQGNLDLGNSNGGAEEEDFGGEDESNEDEDESIDDEFGGENELANLLDEADMPIEELKRKLKAENSGGQSVSLSSKKSKKE